MNAYLPTIAENMHILFYSKDQWLIKILIIEYKFQTYTIQNLPVAITYDYPMMIAVRKE